MSERIYWGLNQSYGFDNHLRFRYGEAGQKALNPLEPIPDKNLCLGMIDNSILKPGRLMVFGKDREIIKVTVPETGETLELGLPGKSALIITEPSACNRDTVKDIVVINFGRGRASGRYLHAATVGEIEEAGWLPIWAPLQLKKLMDHVRVIAKRTIETGEDPTIEDAENLARTFKKIC